MFTVDGRKELVAKIYTSPLERSKAQKLVAMAGVAKPALLKIAAWPLDLLVDSKEAACGFIMSRVNARGAIHQLYNPKSRAKAFPEADFRFLVHVAADVAWAFAVVHGQGHVVGDVNHANLLVGTDGTVKFIDCDSFQLRVGKGHDRPKVYTCDVGVPLYTPPELQARTFRGLERTVNHDRFGLAVLLFHLLYMGRHPFAGRYSGSGDMPIEQAIAEYRFAYDPDCRMNGMERPRGTIPLETMGGDIAGLFIQAFGRGGSRAGRPVATTWAEALEKLKSRLRVCPRESRHHYPRELAVCPWCPVESQGVYLFGGQRNDLDTLWRAILAVPEPGPDPALPSDRPWHPRPGVKIRKRHFRKLRKVIWPTEEQVAVHKVYSAEAEWKEALVRWHPEASRDAFVEKLKDLEKAHSAMMELQKEWQGRLANLRAVREQQQLRYHLNGFHLDQANISRILASRGIKTAADITQEKLLQVAKDVPSILMHWRKRLERNFRFDPDGPVYRREVDAIDQELGARRQNLLITLRQGPDDLRRLSQEINAARLRLMPVLESAWDALKTAEAILAALR